MRRILAVTVTALLGLGILSALSPAADAATKFRSCGSLRAKYPYGVAESRSAARAVIADGFELPDINKAVYNANWRRLDPDGDGVVCKVMTDAQVDATIQDLFEKRICDGQAVIHTSDQMPAYCKKYGY